MKAKEIKMMEVAIQPTISQEATKMKIDLLNKIADEIYEERKHEKA